MFWTILSAVTKVIGYIGTILTGICGIAKIVENVFDYPSSYSFG